MQNSSGKIIIIVFAVMMIEMAQTDRENESHRAAALHDEPETKHK